MHRPVVLLLALVGTAGSSAIATPPAQVVFGIAAQAPTSPKSAVPGGIAGVTDARFTNFNNKIYRSPTTNQWLVVATTNATPATADQIFVVGSGLTCTVVAREGVTEFTPGQTLNFSRLDVPRINDFGQYAMAFRLGTAGATTADEKVVKWNGTAFELLAGAGIEIPAIPGSFYGGSCNGATISNAGNVSFLATVAPITGTGDLIFGGNGSTVLVEPFITSPGNQTDPSATVNDVDTNLLTTSADGLHFAALGKVGLDTTIDRVLIVDNNVVLQKGSVIPGFTPASPINTIVDALMESNGDWYARGTNADGVIWIVRNGVAVAQSGAPIVPGSTELWETFRDVKGNNRGDFVISGNTNNLSLVDDVLVLNGRKVLLRESDPVDLDGNGAFDDSLFVHLIQDKATYNNDGYYYFATRLKSSATATAGANGSNNASLLRVFACLPDFNDDGSLDPDDLADFIGAFFSIPSGAGSDFNADGTTDPDDLADYIGAFFNGC